MKVLIIVLVAGGLILPVGCGDGSTATGSSDEEPSKARLSREKIEVALDSADAQRRGGHFRKAEAILEALLERVPDEFEAVEMLGQVLLQRGATAQQEGRAEEAREAFEDAWKRYRKAVEIRPNIAGVAQSAGEVASLAGHTEDALEMFLAAERLDPSNVKHALYAAQMYLALGRVNQAYEAIQRALQLDAHEPYVLATLANIQFERGEKDKAIETIRDARHYASPDQALPLRVMEARLHRLSGDLQTAVQMLLPLEKELRVEAGVTSELSAAFDAMGEKERSLDVWTERFMATGDGHAAVEAGLRCVELSRVREVDIWLQRAQINGATEEDVSRLLAALAKHAGTTSGESG